MNKNILKQFLIDISLLHSFLKKNEVNNSLLYMKYSPFVYNVIFWNKGYTVVFREFLNKNYGISYDLYLDDFSLISKIDFEIYLEMNKVLPLYKQNKTYWLNIMFFSILHSNFIINNGFSSIYFEKYKNLININILQKEHIVLPLWIMFSLVDKYVKDNFNKYNWYTLLESNNLILMLLSDYRDILYWNKNKEYFYNISDIRKKWFYLVWELLITEDYLLKLDFISLMSLNNLKNS